MRYFFAVCIGIVAQVAALPVEPYGRHDSYPYNAYNPFASYANGRRRMGSNISEFAKTFVEPEQFAQPRPVRRTDKHILTWKEHEYDSALLNIAQPQPRRPIGINIQDLEDQFSSPAALSPSSPHPSPQNNVAAQASQIGHQPRRSTAIDREDQSPSSDYPSPLSSYASPKPHTTTHTSKNEQTRPGRLTASDNENLENQSSSSGPQSPSNSDSSPQSYHSTQAPRRSPPLSGVLSRYNPHPEHLNVDVNSYRQGHGNSHAPLSLLPHRSYPQNPPYANSAAYAGMSSSSTAGYRHSHSGPLRMPYNEPGYAADLSQRLPTLGVQPHLATSSKRYYSPDPVSNQDRQRMYTGVCMPGFVCDCGENLGTSGTTKRDKRQRCGSWAIPEAKKRKFSERLY